MEKSMKPSNFLNDIFTKGAILGVVMLASNIIETSMMYYGATLSWVFATSIEILVVMALYCWLIFRFTKRHAELVVRERSEMPYFTYFNGLNYAIDISMLAGVVVGLGSYMFRHYVIGFENYIAGYVKLVQDIVSQSEVPASMIGTYEQMFKSIESQSEPSLISSIFSSVTNYLIAGTLVGLVVAAKTKREPKIFDEKNEQ